MPTRTDTPFSLPLVGVSTYAPTEQNRGFTTPPAYIDAVVRAGGLPVLLPHVAPLIPQWLAVLDAVILIGGGDIDPVHYQQTPHEMLYGMSAQRDAFDLALARAVLARHIPLLAICRGLQIINVALGGSLHQHLPDVVGEETAHRSAERTDIQHTIRCDPQSRLAALLGEECTAASWHHQAIDRLGEGLQAVAWAPDGTVEAVACTDHPQCLAVQWHPELTAGTDAGQQELFNELVRLGRVRQTAHAAVSSTTCVHPNRAA